MILLILSYPPIPSSSKPKPPRWSPALRRLLTQHGLCHLAPGNRRSTNSWKAGKLWRVSSWRGRWGESKFFKKGRSWELQGVWGLASPHSWWQLFFTNLDFPGTRGFPSFLLYTFWGEVVWGPIVWSQPALACAMRRSPSLWPNVPGCIQPWDSSKKGSYFFEYGNLFSNWCKK